MVLPRPIPDPLIALISHRLHALGQPLRIRIIDHLDQSGETTVQDLAEKLDSGQQNMSRHLSLLHQTGVVARRREGRQVWYSLTSPDIFSLLEQVGTQIAPQLRQRAP